jgi:hypothetical protein
MLYQGRGGVLIGRAKDTRGKTRPERECDDAVLNGK